MVSNMSKLLCERCDIELNPIQSPRVYDHDLDPRDVDGGEYCCDCWTEAFVWCEVCGQDVDREDLCPHLFYDADGVLNGPGSNETAPTRLQGAEDYIKPAFLRSIQAVCHSSVVSNLRWQGVDTAINTTLSNLRTVRDLLIANNLSVYEHGSIFGPDDVIFESIESAPFLRWSVYASDRLLRAAQRHRDGGAWLLCLGSRDTAEFNAQAAGWLDELLPRLERVYSRYSAMKFAKEGKIASGASRIAA